MFDQMSVTMRSLKLEAGSTLSVSRPDGAAANVASFSLSSNRSTTTPTIFVSFEPTINLKGSKIERPFER